MTDEIKTGGPAFPQSGAINGAGDVWVSSELGGSGLTVHDYFSAKAMAALIHRYADVNIDDLKVLEEIAIRASNMADAMIKARG
ncbi:hypothetical protein [Yersinia massiliensis]|uniref:Uncharacterized protein n=1 Tax=Yersinia massiliensis TaxID=419257 RepID=A0ABM6UVN9_9GAMM|nr:hypothetical protein [Yersinia massiliensis]AVX39071.1 hypothetical protein DA391_16170 [Yersinia massiliensis]